MSESIITWKTVRKCFAKIIHYIHRIIVFIGRLIFSTIYKSNTQCIPRVTNPLLLEPAMSLAEKIRTKKISSEELVKAYIDRIKEVNSTLNCFVEDRFNDAIKEAKEVDELIASGKMTEEQIKKEKPLLGVPFTTKDCIAIKDLHHTAGIYLRKDIVAMEDAEVVKNTRNAGAIPLGLTNISEFCMWWESHNHIHGRTNNPYDTTRIVGGSSGGEGCMQAAVGSAFGIGSDIGGSIRMPSFFNGIFGHKPSKFVVSNKGQFPIPASEFQASFLGVGPMTRHATDLKPLLKIFAKDNAEKLKLDEEVDVKNIKVFYQRNSSNPLMVCDIEPSIQAAMLSAVNHMRRICGTKPEELKLKKLSKSNPIWLANMKVKGAPTFAKQITGNESLLNVCIELCKSVIGSSKNTLIGLVTAIVDQGGDKPGTPKHDYLIRQRQELEDELKQILKDDGVLLYPTHPTAALYHNEPIIRPFNFCYTSIINVLGFPATHIPMGLNEEGLPIGIQVISNTNNDRLCLAIAEELENAFGGWVEPAGSKKEE